MNRTERRILDREKSYLRAYSFSFWISVLFGIGACGILVLIFAMPQDDSALMGRYLDTLFTCIVWCFVFLIIRNYMRARLDHIQTLKQRMTEVANSNGSTDS